MSTSKHITDIIKPKYQENLYGFQEYFNLFMNLYEKKKLPNTILLSGSKGIGKSTFVYHFINYLLSKNAEHPYLINDYKINLNNSSFKLIHENIHPNFYLLDNEDSDEYIKIEQVRNLLSFLRKSTYSKDLKIVFIDNAEFLNANSANSLLKILEEPSPNTFFFINHNSSSTLIDTIKSRCIKFKFHFNFTEKKNIFDKINKIYDLSFKDDFLNNFLHFESHGNLIKYLFIMNNINVNLSLDNVSLIASLIDKYKTEKDIELLNLITLFIENHYNTLSKNNINLINYYSLKKTKILYLINDMRKFNLDKKNLLISIDKIIKSEEK